jgi:hypothetical protein
MAVVVTAPSRPGPLTVQGSFLEFDALSVCVRSVHAESVAAPFECYGLAASHAGELQVGGERRRDLETTAGSLEPGGQRKDR